MSDLRAITVQLPESLYHELRDLAKLLGKPVRAIVVTAVRREIDRRREDGGEALTRALDTMRDYRETREADGSGEKT